MGVSFILAGLRRRLIAVDSRAARHGAAVALTLACSGCGWLSEHRAPRKLATFGATPLPASSCQPPVEPPPTKAVTEASPAATVTLEPPPAPEPTPPAAPAPLEALTKTQSDVDRLNAEITELRKQQLNLQTALESLTAASTASASRSAAIEAHLALQSSLIDDLRTATQQQQRKQWEALDAVSDGLDRLLKNSQVEPARKPAPVPATPAPAPPVAPPAENNAPGPEELLLQEILSQDPSVSERGPR